MDFIVITTLLLFIGRIDAALLRTGKPMNWQASKVHLAGIRNEGVRQFLSHYNRCKIVETPGFIWGDEIEFGLFRKDNVTRLTDLALGSGSRTRQTLQSKEYGISAVTEPRPPQKKSTCIYSDFIGSTVDSFNSKTSCHQSSTTKTNSPLTSNDCDWQPEYGSWMIEAVPKDPFSSDTVDELLNVEKSMQLRRKRLHMALAANEIAPTVSAFPMMGVTGYPHTTTTSAESSNSTHEGGSPSESKLVSDALINEHPRFAALTRNIRLRRGSKVNIVVPADDDPDQFPPVANRFSSSSKVTGPAETEDVSASVREDIHMDAMAFGMGCSCLQVTIQAHNEDESRFLHDQLAILAPILHALSAATPIFKGKLAATDTRWSVISQAVDDRTPAERRTAGTGTEVFGNASIDPLMVGGGVRQLAQSRYSEVPLYIARTRSAEEKAALSALNDVEVAVDDDAYRMLHTEGGVDESLSRHIAHLFARDPLVIFDDSVPVQSNVSSLEHFENIQSTNWRSMRWKPPSLELGLQSAALRDSNNVVPNASPPQLQTTHEPVHQTVQQPAGQEQLPVQPGWRVEFRPQEVQLTDFENAAFAVLVVLLARALLAQGHNFYLPMSLVHENMRRAQLKDAVLTQKFWFRRNSLRAASHSAPFSVPTPGDIDLAEMTIDEILNGQQAEASYALLSGSEKAPFEGLLPQLAQFVRTHLLPQQEPATVTEQSISGFNEVGQPAGAARARTDWQCGLGQLRPYVDLIRDRAAGRLPTTARWLRNQVTRHPQYVRNSGTVTPAVANDLLQRCEDVGMGRVPCPELYGTARVENLDFVAEADLVYPEFAIGSRRREDGEAYPCLSIHSVTTPEPQNASTTCVYKCV